MKRNDYQAHPVDIHVGQKIHAKRVACALTQEELGKKLGLTAQQVQKYEKGINRVSASRLFELAQELETDVTTFFEGLKQSKQDARSALLNENPEIVELFLAFMTIEDKETQNAIANLIKKLKPAG